MDAESLPPITSTWVACAVLLSLLERMDIVSRYQLLYAPHLVFRDHQYWRLLTTFLYFGRFDVDFVFRIIFSMRYAHLLEVSTYGASRRADYAWLLLTSCAALLLLSPILLLPYMSNPLAMVLTYVWSRKNRHAQLRVLGLFAITAPYMPLIIAGFDAAMHASSENLKCDFVGIAIGHLCTYALRAATDSETSF